MTDIRIEDGSGNEKAKVTLVSGEIENVVGKMKTARFVIYKSDVSGITLEEEVDEIFLVEGGSDTFGGTLQDHNRYSAGEIELIVHSFEQYAVDAKPSDGGIRRDNVSDSTVVTEAIDGGTGIPGVPDLSTDTINNVKSGLSFLLSHATMAKIVRKVADPAGAFPIYNPDKTVDFVGSIGSDKSTTIDPDNGNLVERLSVETKGNDETATHVRMIGAGEGAHQVTADVVASSYSSGDRERWQTFANKDLHDESTLKEHGNEIISDFESSYIRARGTLYGVTPNLGDSYPVNAPDRGLNDERLTVVENRRKISSKGDRYNVVLSSRPNIHAPSGEKERKDIERYNKAVQGVAVPINVGGDRKPVTSTDNYVMKVYYPSEVVYEHRLNVRVIGLPYRAYSSGAASSAPAHSHDVTVTHPDHTHDVTHPQHSHDVSTTATDNSDFSSAVVNDNNTDSAVVGDSGWTTISSITPSVKTSVLTLSALMFHTDTGSPGFRTRLRNTSTNTTYNQTPVWGVGENDFSLYWAADPSNVKNETVELQAQAQSGTIDELRAMRMWLGYGPHTHDVADTSTAELGTTETSTAALGTTETSTSEEVSPAHTHDPNPGLSEFSGRLPKNCDVYVNGTSQGVSFGDGQSGFEEVVDITGSLNTGQVNTIEVDSENIGHLMVYVEGDVYRQILGDG